jgi:hypothetical protein
VGGRAMTTHEKISRRTLLERAGLVLAAAIAPAERAAGDEETKEGDKITQKDATYQTHPKGQQRCAICLQFEPPGKCHIVQGPITPQGWCQFFAARENAH